MKRKQIENKYLLNREIQLGCDTPAGTVYDLGNTRKDQQLAKAMIITTIGETGADTGIPVGVRSMGRILPNEVLASILAIWAQLTGKNIVGLVLENGQTIITNPVTKEVLSTASKSPLLCETCNDIACEHNQNKAVSAPNISKTQIKKQDERVGGDYVV